MAQNVAAKITHIVDPHPLMKNLSHFTMIECDGCAEQLTIEWDVDVKLGSHYQIATLEAIERAICSFLEKKGWKECWRKFEPEGMEGLFIYCPRCRHNKGL
jgi:hypothetical protein